MSRRERAEIATDLIIAVSARLMEIKQKDDGRKGSFYIETDGANQAEMTYVWAGPDKIIKMSFPEGTDGTHLILPSKTVEGFGFAALFYGRSAHLPYFYATILRAQSFSPHS